MFTKLMRKWPNRILSFYDTNARGSPLNASHISETRKSNKAMHIESYITSWYLKSIVHNSLPKKYVSQE